MWTGGKGGSFPSRQTNVWDMTRFSRSNPNQYLEGHDVHQQQAQSSQWSGPTIEEIPDEEGYGPDEQWLVTRESTPDDANA